MGMSGVSTLKAGHSIPAEAELGRFISRDPIGFRGGLNLFNGAGTNPVTFTDASGLFIKAILETQKGLLIVEDYGPCSGKQGWKLKSRKEYKVFSGDKKAMNDPSQGHVPFIGPVPRGHYYLGSPVDVGVTHQELVGGNLNWIPILNKSTLENVHEVIDPNGNVVNRDEFYVHPGLISQGCVTFKSDIARGQPGYPGSSSYNEFYEMLTKTTPLSVDIVDPGFMWSSVESHTVQGTLEVR
jgi:hypothetical protein